MRPERDDRAVARCDAGAAAGRSRKGRAGAADRALAAALAALALAGCVTINLPGGRRGPLEEVTVRGEGPDKILVLDLSGFILGETRLTLLGLSPLENTVERVGEELERAARDPAVKGVVLRINSPGGTVTASDVLYNALRRYKARAGVPVVAALLDVATSGAYYVAMAADEVIAHPTTITGSIGVVYALVSAAGLYDKLGLADQTVKSDRYKDIGSPRRAPTAEERAILQSQIDDLFRRFLATVQAGRPRLSPEQIRSLADGRPYTAQQALAAGLVDAIGYLDDAVEAVQRRAKLPRARVVVYVRPGAARPTHLYAGTPPHLPASAAHSWLAQLAGTGGPAFLYLWTGW
ncbi:MAG TPA: signal peptide peptidase SppA [Thermodesulfobacteriota bacterium]|nr:signal peptide peptidase SppA [Thermodesulfobacteriota bacterium]